jgi:hypothetical protein
MGSARDDRVGAMLVMAEGPKREPGCTDGCWPVPTVTTAELGELEHLAQRLIALSAHRPDFARRAQRLADRIATQRFHIAVLGDFKRGKSTLVNALIGQPLLPSGVVPLTTVATEVHFGSEQTTVFFADGRRRIVAPDALGDYVTERGNPSNIKRVDRVEVGVDAVSGAPGLVLVDTPGIALVNQHNDAYGFPWRAQPWVEGGAMTTQPRERDARERPVVAERHRRRERARRAPRRPTCCRDRERGR